MRIRVETIPDEGLSFSYEEQAETFPVLEEMSQSGECKFTAPVTIRLKAIRVRDMIEVEGQFHTVVRLTCSRCLNEYEAPLKSRFSLTYVRELPASRDTVAKNEIEIGEDDVGLIHFVGEHIDLRDGIQEQIVLAFPMRLLCSGQCKGLCVQCGADLNKGDCDCRPERSGSGFSALKDVRVRQK